MMGESLCVSLRQLNCFYPAHGAEKGREVEDKGVVVGMAGWGGPTSERKPEDTDLSLFFPLLALLSDSILNTISCLGHGLVLCA